ncbi:DUF1203 domain-containing protein [Hymenobacter sp. BT664]|uniref:DUF1203 domain-containing protein n=1 Tax=Hymenobacter montanus TaxID=2771359 RepID=A0A927BEH3_9BACT|nr:DUF1203 domain-containing protein [Hymenobacter montanus]MBD2768679.1 DUF1203 domain-containing protein [Hymenobacter montanus]
MSNFQIVPLSAETAQRIRTTRQDDFGHAVVEQLATGYGPCRVSLRPFAPGQDRRLLFSYSPFALANAFNQNGPVFIAASEVEPYATTDQFPPEIKADKVNFPLSLVGYSADQRMVFTRLVGEADVDELIEEVLATNPDIAYLHARNAEAQCFICQINRA